MKSMKSKIFHATKKGQITLPAEWRKRFDTEYFLLQERDGVLVVSPVFAEGEEVIFNAERDSAGEAVAVTDFAMALRQSLQDAG